MATELGAAYISVGLSTKGLGGDIKKSIGGQLDSAGDAAGKSSGKRFGLGFAGVAAAALGSLGVGSFFKGAISEASGLGESLNALNVVYGKNSAGIAKLGKSAATSLGLSNLEFNNLAVRFSSFAQTISGPGGNVVGTLDDLTTRASDFASVMNLEVADAAQLFQSGLAGESEPLRQFGIDLSAAAVEAFALEKGISSSASEMTEAEKVQARYGLLMEKTKQTAGDFANTSDSLANRQRILNSQWANAKARIGEGLLPAVSSFVGLLSNALAPATDKAVAGINWITKAGQGLHSLFVKGDFTTAFREAFKVEEDSKVVDFLFRIRDAFTGIRDLLFKGDFTGALTRAFGVEEDAPIVDALFRVREGFLNVRAAAKSFIDSFKAGNAAGGIGTFISTILQSTAGLRDGLIQTMATLIPAILQQIIAAAPMILTAAVQSFSTALVTTIPPLVTAIMGMLPVIISTLLGMVPLLLAAGLQLFQGLVSSLVVVIPQVVTALIGMLPQLSSTILAMLPTIISAALGMFMGIVQALVKLLPVLISAVMKLLPSIVSSLMGMLPTIINSALTLFLGVVTGLLRALPSILTALLRMLPQLISTLIGMIPALIQAAVQLFKGIVQALPTVIPLIVSALVGIGPELVGAVISMVPLLVRAGGDLIGGLVQGLMSAAGSVGAALIDIAGGAIEGFKSFLGIKSPSRVFKGFGGDIGQGLILGIEGTQGKVASSIERLVPIPKAPSFSAGVYSAAATVGGSGGDVVINGNVGWDPHRVAQEIEVNKRRVQTMAGMGGVVFA